MTDKENQEVGTPEKIELDLVFQKKFKVGAESLGLKGAALEEAAKEAVIRYSSAPANADAMMNLPLRKRLRWHTEGAVVSFGVFAVCTTAVVLAVKAMSGSEDTAVATPETTPVVSDPFSDVSGVESTARPLRSAK
jgi:hypothetical protein